MLKWTYRCLSVLALVGFLPMSLWAHLAHESIKVKDAWVRAVPPNSSNSAAYLVLENHAMKADRLISVKSPIANVVELHNVVKKGEAMAMEPVAHIEVDAHGSTTLKPGGFHIMLIDLKRVPKAGEEVELMLTFQNAGEQKIMAPVKKGGMSGHKHMAHDHPKKENGPMQMKKDGHKMKDHGDHQMN